MQQIDRQKNCFITKHLCEHEKNEVRQKVCSHLEALVEIDGNFYCILHLANEHEKKKKDEFETAYRNKVTANDFNFQWVHFPNHLFVNKKSFENEVDFTNADFKNGVCFISCVFKSKFLIDNSIINGELKVEGSSFDCEAVFQQCQVNGQFSLHKTHFNNTANFSLIKVCGFAYLSENYFHKDANFKSSHFCKKVDFNKCEFNKTTFEYAKFFGEATFDKAQFLSEVRFDYSQFGEFVEFRETIFKYICVFDNCLFNHETYFYRAVFDDIAYFENTNFAKDNASSDCNHGGYFDQCKFNSSARFNNSKFKFARFFSSEFKKTINFTKIEVHKDACFEASIFECDLIFRDAKFLQKVSFSYSSFKNYVNFRGNNNNKIFYGILDLQETRISSADKLHFQTVRLHPNWFVNINSQKLTFANISWGNTDGTRKAIEAELEALKKRQIKENAHRLLIIACRQLASNAEENNRFEEASNFRRMSFETEWLEKGVENNKRIDKIFRSAEIIKRRFIKKKVDLSAPLKRTFYIFRHFDFVHPLYRITSFYGESWGRAAFVLAVAILLFFPFIYTLVEFQVSPKTIPLEVVVKDCKEVTDQLKPVCKIENRVLSFWNGESISHSLATATLQTVENRIPMTFCGSFWTTLERIFVPLQAALLALAIRRKFMR